MMEHHLTVSRTARYFTLGDPASARHVWIACHGYGQMAEKFLSYLVTLDNGERLIVAPEALSRFYHEKGRGPVGASWMTREDREHEIGDYVTYLDRLVETLRPSLVPSVPVYGLGFSQGVATVSRWLTRGKTRFTGMTFWAGTIPADLGQEDLATRVKDLRIALVAGSADEFIANTWIAQEQERLSALGAHCTTYPFHGGHRLDRTILAQLTQNMEKTNTGG
jgi:predicted esterase